jgi:hypothetical protein
MMLQNALLPLRRVQPSRRHCASSGTGLRLTAAGPVSLLLSHDRASIRFTMQPRR